MIISLQFKFAFLKQLGNDLMIGFNRSVDHLYVFFWGKNGYKNSLLVLKPHCSPVREFLEFFVNFE